MGTVPYLLQGLGLQTPWVMLMLEIKGEAQFCVQKKLLEQRGFFLMTDGENHCNKNVEPFQVGTMRMERSGKNSQWFLIVWFG